MRNLNYFSRVPSTRLLVASIALTLLLTGVVSAQGPTYEFAKKLEGVGENNRITTVVDAFGNIYLGGQFSGTVDFDPGAGVANRTATGASDMFLAKYTSAGVFVWAFSIGGTLNDRIFQMALDGLGNVIVAGHFSQFNSKGTDFDPGSGTALRKGNRFIAKYSPSGTHVWSIALTSDDGQQITELALDMGLTLDGSGNIYATYLLNGTVDFNPSNQTNNLTGSNEVVIAKYTSAGGYVWAKKFIGPAAYDWSVTAQTVVAGTGDIYLAGRFAGTIDFDPSSNAVNLTSLNNDAGGGNLFVAKYSSAGAYQWAIPVGSTRPCHASSLAVDDIGNVLITGAFRGAVDFDPGPGTSFLTTDTSGTWNAMFVAKYTNAGALLSAFQAGGGGLQTVTGSQICVDPAGSVYVFGAFAGTVDFDPGVGLATLSSVSTYPQGGDCYVVKYSSSGEYRWAFNIGGAQSDIPHAMFLNGTNVVVCGVFNNLVDFDPESSTAYLSANTNGSYFFAKYSQNGGAKEGPRPVFGTKNTIELRATPNPFHSAITIELLGETSGAASVEVFDITGRQVGQYKLDNGSSGMFGAELPIGTYVLRVNGEGVRRELTILKQR